MRKRVRVLHYGVGPIGASIARLAREKQAVEIIGAARTLYLSGQVGADTTGKIPDDVTAQARLV